MKRLMLLSLLALGLFTALQAPSGHAQSAAPASGSTTDTAAVLYLSGDDGETLGRMVVEGETLSTQEGAMLRLPDGSDVELDQKTTIEVRTLARANGPAATHLHLRRGAVRVAVPPRPVRGAVTFRVTSPVSTAGVRGTDFSVAYEPGSATSTVTEEADVDVFEGTVEVDNGQASMAGEPELVSAGNGATVSRRAVRRRAVAEAMRERWENRRERIIDRLRTRMKLGPDDDVAEKLREHLRNLPPEKRQQIQERIQRFQAAQRARVQARSQAIHERRQERRETGRPVNPRPTPYRGRR